MNYVCEVAILTSVGETHFFSQQLTGKLIVFELNPIWCRQVKFIMALTF